MRKDKFGICFNFYAVLGFVLALLGHTTLALLLLGFVIVIHQDQWLTMQVMQAFFLSIVAGIVSTIVGIISPIYVLDFPDCYHHGNHRHYQNRTGTGRKHSPG